MKYLILILILIPLGCKTAEKVIVVKDDPYANISDVPEVHGFSLFGSKSIYASHRPKFGGSFNYQVILEISMLHSGSDPDNIYRLDPPRTGSPAYSLKPEKFALEELLTLNKARPTRTTFRATLYRGPFWDGGQPVLQDIHVKVRRLIFQNRFSERAKPLPHLMYYTFGNDHELFAAHLINEYPDFDHLVRIDIEEGVFSQKEANQIKRGKLITFPSLMNAFPNALDTGEKIKGNIQGTKTEIRVHTKVGEAVLYERIKLY